MTTLYDLIELYDNWNGTLVVNDKNLKCVLRTDFNRLEKSYEIKRQALYFAEVMAFGFYDGELCVRVNYTTEDEKKTWVRVQAWDREFKYIGNIDISDLKPGMLVRELGGLREVTGEVYDDGIDYVIPVDNNEAYSPLLLV